MKFLTFISAAAVLFGGVLASPVESVPRSTQSAAGCKTVEAHIESINEFPDQVGVLGDIKLLVDHSDTVLKDMNARLARLGVDKYAVRHRSLSRRHYPENTGKLVPIAKLAEKIQIGINALTKIILELECPSSLPMEDFTDCVAAQEDPLRRLREWYPESLDWDATDNQGPPNAATTYGCGAPAPSRNLTSSTSSIVTVTSTTSIPASSSTSSSASVTTSPKVTTSASVTTSKSVATSTLNTTSTYTTSATVTLNPSQTVIFTLTTETTIATTRTSTVDVTKTIDVTSTSTIDVASVIYPTIGSSGTTTTTSSSITTTTSCITCGTVTPVTSYRTVYLHTTSSPYLYSTLTPIVSTTTSPTSTPTVFRTVYASGTSNGPFAYPTVASYTPEPSGTVVFPPPPYGTPGREPDNN